MLSLETLQGIENPVAQQFILNTYAERYSAGRLRAKVLCRIAHRIRSQEKGKEFLKKANKIPQKKLESPI